MKDFMERTVSKQNALLCGSVSALEIYKECVGGLNTGLATIKELSRMFTTCLCSYVYELAHPESSRFSLLLSHMCNCPI